MRYPFRHYGLRFLKAYGGAYSDTSFPSIKRRVLLMATQFETLFSKSRISSGDPSKLTVEDVLVYVSYLRKDLGLSASYISHMVGTLSRICSMAGNNCVTRCRLEHPAAFPKRYSKRLSSLTKGDFDYILTLCNSFEGVSFRMLRARAIVALSLCGGLRHIELRYAKVHNLNLADRTMYLDVVKGGKSYGSSRTVSLIPACERVLRAYISSRGDIPTPYLFVSFSGSGPLSDNSIREDVEIFSKSVGMDFDLRMCRRSYGQMAKDLGMTIEDVSVLLGHSSTKTTEAYYARVRSDAVLERASEIFSEDRMGNEKSGGGGTCDRRASLTDLFQVSSFPTLNYGGGNSVAFSYF